MVWSNLNGMVARGSPARRVRVIAHIGSEPIGATGRFHKGNRWVGRGGIIDTWPVELDCL